MVAMSPKSDHEMVEMSFDVISAHGPATRHCITEMPNIKAHVSTPLVRAFLEAMKYAVQRIELMKASTSPRSADAPPDPAPSTTPATPAKLVSAKTTCNPRSRSPSRRGATSSVKAVLRLPMMVELTIDVVVKDMNPEIVDQPKMNPGTTATLNAAHVRRMRLSFRITNSTIGQNRTR